MKRMVIATVLLIVTVAVFIMSYAVVVLPLEYTTSTLQDTYDDIATDMGWDDADETSSLIGMIPYFFAGAIILGIFLLFVWFFAFAQKKEYERY